MNDGSDLEARGMMMKAAMMGAVAFQKGLGACHSLAHPLSSEHGLHHGLANALCLPAVLRFNAHAVPERVQRVGMLLGAPADPLACATAVADLRARLGLEAVFRRWVSKRPTCRSWRTKPSQTRVILVIPTLLGETILLTLYEASL